MREKIDLAHGATLKHFLSIFCSIFSDRRGYLNEKM